MHFHTKALDHFQVQDSLCATKVNSEKAAIKKVKLLLVRVLSLVQAVSSQRCVKKINLL